MICSKLPAYIALTRAYMAVVLGSTTVCGYSLSGGALEFHLSLVLLLAQGCLAAGGFALNDVLDRDRDQQVDCKPLATGKITLSEARSVAVLLIICGLVTSSVLGATPLLIGLAQVSVVAVYSWLKRRSGVLANATTAVLCSSGFFFGAATHMQLGTAWVPALLSLQMVWAREIVKDVLDIEPDRAVRLPTVPLRYGLRLTSIAVTTLVLTAITTSLWPSVRQLFGGAYLPVIILTDSILLLAIIVYLKRGDQQGTSSFLHLTAGAFSLALVACLL